LPDKRTHRGKHPEDDRLFAEAQIVDLRRAVQDLTWLLSHGYAEKSSLKLVGDRYALKDRQRMAVMRSACSDEDLAARLSRQVLPAALVNQPLLIDGYNIITTIETALGGGVVLKARDGSLRDIAGLHGTYRKVQETMPSLELIGRYLAKLDISLCQWFLDSPVSNTGRLKTMLLKLADENHWNWEVQVVTNPDPILIKAENIVSTSDSIILNSCHKWLNLTEYVISNYIPDALIVDLSLPPAENVISHQSPPFKTC